MSCFARASVALFGSLMSSAALAQAVDYASLEETIGEPVTTSVTGKPQRASETSASIEIITRDQIAHSPAHDVPGVLQTYAGIDINRWTASQSEISVRGGVQTYNPRLLVLVNGRQVYLDHYGMTDWNLLGVQLEEIQQIELVRGPATALFGFNAASGVINIITVSAIAGSSLRMSGEAGTHGYDRLSVVATLPIGSYAGLRVSGGHQREHERDFAADEQQPVGNRPAERDEIDATLEVLPDTRTHVTVDGGYSRHRGLELLPTQIATRQLYHATNAGVRIDRDTDWGTATGRVYVNWLDALYGTDGQPSELKSRTVVAQGSTLIRLGLNNVLRLSAEYRGNRLDSAVTFSPRIDYTVWSGSAMLDLHPSDKFALTFAGRLDRLGLAQDGTPVVPSANALGDFNRHFARASFNAAALVGIGETGQLRINGGRGYQIPSLVDFGVRLPLVSVSGLPLLLAGDPSLNPVAVWSAEIGYAQPLSETVKADASLFYNKVAHAIASSGGNPLFTLTTIGSPALVTRFGDDGSFSTWGIELSVEGKVGRHLSWRGNYTFTDTHQRLQPLASFALSPATTTARNKGNIEIGYANGNWFATTVARFTSATRQIGVSNAGAFGLFHVNSALALDQKIGFALGKATLTLTGENLTGAGGASGSSIRADRRVLAGIGLAL